MNALDHIRKAESFRFTVHSSGLARVENCFVSPSRPLPSGFETNYQIVLPYHGLFAYRAGSRRWLLDPTRTLCISPGWEYFEDRPLTGLGHAALLLNPSACVMDELYGARAADKNPAFTQASLPSTSRLQMLAHSLLRRSSDGGDSLRDDEWVIAALSALTPPRTSRRRASKVIDRAKEVLHAHDCERLTLEHVARTVGVSPVYLTQEFSRSEGVPLYRYQLGLRLNRALFELTACESITELALDLGFSSHSHFTSVFRRAFGVTPSDYRAGHTPTVDGLAARRIINSFHRKAA
jgi:AraC family transcriptional regulator